MLGSTNILAYAAIAATTLSTVCDAHFFISSPTPIQGSAPKDPLEASGSNFPCHGVALPSSGGQKMAAGSSQNLKFELNGGLNTAVHGGGSCQLSLLYDISKAKDPSAWHVIYSIEGGCPANIKGNFPEGGAVACTSENEGDCVHSFDYTIPQGVESGNAILSWTWFNTIGNREIYQNCAAVEITDGTGSEMSSLPAMFVANVASVNDCHTTEQEAVGFPDPGKYVIQQTATNGFSYPVSTLACGGGAAAPSSYGGASSTAAATATSSAYAAPTSSAYAAPSSAAAVPTSAPAITNPVSSAPPAYQTGGAVTETTYATTFATVTAGSPGPSASSPAEASPSALASSPGPAAKSSDGSVSCSDDGGVVCIDATHFGICNFGSAVPMPLAAGTTCANGVVSRKKRSARHMERHRRGVGHVHEAKL
ncbi:hypothetical protein B0A48_00850 [Cryoendolithus antarcticus]|uniref:Chitin-binding type-4 domain-containing protein n=1 Tax=Cryoendolithus antarcticus TaxID=1507870 RepID=A0A1V8TRJ8_9PEZI|nr:hypothetical protein B0A48_00850 [Cryoendolithus antarcticus]